MPIHSIRLPRNAQMWLPGLVGWTWRRRSRPPAAGPVDILFCVADHFEPEHGNPGTAVERRRIARWMDQYGRAVDGVRDWDGRPPQHTFFYPAEAYRREHLDALAALCRAGWGEVEIHLHHDGDTGDNLRRSLVHFRDTLSGEHGLLSAAPGGQTGYAFVHGNWALDNSGWKGQRCGVNDELSILRETGCFADLTMPSAPNYSQTRTVNSVYHAVDDPARPKSHDVGIEARVGGDTPSGSLLMIQGPLRLVWRDRKFGILPRLENGGIHYANPPSLRRFADWVAAGVSVRGRDEWIAVKVYTHGAIERNADVWLGPGVREFHQAIGEAFNDGRRYRLHYVTARELTNIMLAAMAGKAGNPHAYRSFVYSPTRGGA